MKNTVTSIFCGAVLLSMASTTQGPKAVWSLNLSTLAAYRDTSEIPGSLPNRLSITFLDEDTIAVFVQFEFRAHPISRSRDDVEAALRSMHDNSAILTIDAKNGTSQKSQVWKGPPAEGVYSTGNSGCLVMVGAQLLSLSQTLEVVAKRVLPRNPIIDLPHGIVGQDDWTVLTDPRSKKALLVRFPFVPGTTGRKFGDAHWISTDTLEDQSSMSIPRWEGTSAAVVGDSVIFGELGVERQPALIQINDKEPRPLCADCFGRVDGTFGNGLVFWDRPNEYLVRDTSGTILFRKTGVGGRADTIGGASGARTSNRVAFQFGHLGRRVLEETVVVLDVDAQKEIWRYKLRQEAVRTEIGGFVRESFPSPRLALSPDGKKLAILSGTEISLFEIP
jgi:hypothetical protein